MRVLPLAVIAFLAAALHLGAPGTAWAADASAPAAAPAAAPPRPQIVLTFANTPAGTPQPAGANGPRYGGSSYMLGQDAHAQATRVAKQYGLKEVASWPIRQLAVHCVVYEVPSPQNVQELLTRLSQDSRVTLAEPLQDFHTLSDPRAGPPAGTANPPSAAQPYNDPLYDLQTNLSQLDIAHAHQRSRGAGVRIGLIDTGVDVHHPDLRGRIAGVRSFVTAHADSPRAYRHGTAMAGLIAAVANNHIGIVGIAPLAQLEVLEACWQVSAEAASAVCNTFTLARALGAALDARVPVVNLSISGPPDPLLTMLVRVGIARGVIFVAAAADASEGFPSTIPGVIVAGSAQHGTWAAQLTAPAERIFTLAPQAEYNMESGTSVAAAEVSGSVALLLSAAGQHLSSDTLLALLSGTAMQPGTAAVPALNINDALARLDEQQHGRSYVSAR